MGKLRHIEVELAKTTQQSVAIQVLASRPNLSWVSGWVGSILRVELAPSLAADPEQGTGVGIGDRAERSCCWMGSFHVVQENL